MYVDTSPTPAEWQMADDYEYIIDIANVNSISKINENRFEITCLAQTQRGIKLGFLLTPEEHIANLKKEIPMVIKKLIAIKSLTKQHDELILSISDLENCILASDFHKIVLKIKEIIPKTHKKAVPFKPNPFYEPKNNW